MDGLNFISFIVRARSRPLVTTAMNIKVPNEAENFLTKLNGYLYMWGGNHNWFVRH